MRSWSRSDRARRQATPCARLCRLRAGGRAGRAANWPRWGSRPRRDGAGDEQSATLRYRRLFDSQTIANTATCAAHHPPLC